MNKIDYSQITTLDELRRARCEADVTLRHLRRSVGNGWSNIKKSFSIANVVASALSNVSVLLTEAEFILRGLHSVRDFFNCADPPSAPSAERE